MSRSLARRVTIDEYLEHCTGKTEYFHGRMVVGDLELFVGVKELAENIAKTNDDPADV